MAHNINFLIQNVNKQPFLLGLHIQSLETKNVKTKLGVGVFTSIGLERPPTTNFFVCF